MFLLILSSLFIINCNASEYTVKYAAVIFRHGARTPITPYPTDPYKNESLWPVRFGHLTNLGVSQHYRLGQWLKNRYEALLPEQYDPELIYVRSTDVDRTISSALANLAGMFPPSGDRVWNTSLMWRPIPVHTVPEDLDDVLAMKKPCPAYDESLKRLTSSKAYVDGLKKYNKLMDYLSENTGLEVVDYTDIMYLYSNLKIETENNFTLPDWTKAVFPGQMEKPACHSLKIATMKPDLARLKTGPLLCNITLRMLRVAQGKDNSKLSIFSAHDITVANFLNALNLFEEHCPSFTATVLIELLQNSSSSSFVRILYRDSTEIVEPALLTIPHCGTICPLDRFISLYNKLISVNIDQDCRSTLYTSGTISAAKIMIFFTICFVVWYYLVWRTRYQRKHRLNTNEF